MTEVLARRSSRALALGLGALFVLAACGGGGGSSGGGGASTTDVTAWTAWGGAELKAFQDVLKLFESSSGIKVLLTTNRSEEHTSELQSHVKLACRLLLEKNNQPDLICTIV